ncbi:MAG: MFS transporter [Alphaproteobacteria bacterium]
MSNLGYRLLDITGFGAVGQSMRHRNFRIYLIGFIPNVIGIWVVRVAMLWLTWELTRSSTWLGIIAAADAMPVMALGPIGGALADRLDRRMICIASQSVLMVISIVLAALTLTGLIEIWTLFALTLARGITFAFWQPVRLAMMPNLVPRNEMAVVIALNSSLFNAAQFVGPAVTAPLLALGNAGYAFAVNVFAAGDMVWALWQIDIPLSEGKGERGGSVFGEAWAGIRYAALHPGIGPILLLLVILGVCVRPLQDLLPAFADLVFDHGADGYSGMVSALGIGAMLAATWMIRRGNSGDITPVALRAGLVAGTTALIFSYIDWYPLGLAGLAIFGFAMTSGGVAVQQLVQQAVPDAMRGRVLSLFGMFFRGGPAFGALVMGWVADAIGLHWPVLAGALIGLTAYGFAWLRRDRLHAALEKEPPRSGTT